MTEKNAPKAMDRKARLSLLATCAAEDLRDVVRQIGDIAEVDIIRPAEVGSVMMRGRMGGTGAAFNVGEMTVTRCTLKLASGEIGHGYVQGRDKEAARHVALLDALCQTEQGPQIDRDLLMPLLAKKEQQKAARVQKAASTKVEFFTMVRGDA